MEPRSDPDAVFAELDFDPEHSALTRRQATVLALREQGLRQREVADLLGTSRANVANVESSARENVAKARETVAFAEALAAPVHVEVEPDTPLAEVPDAVYAACDDAGVTVELGVRELFETVREAAPEAVTNREVVAPLRVDVTDDGAVYVRRAE